MNSGIAVLRSGEEIIDDTVEADDIGGIAGRSDISTAMAYLLSDNYEIGSLYVFWHSGFEYFNPIPSANYIILNDTVVVFDPVRGMSGDADSYTGLSLPEITAKTLEAYADAVESSSIGTQIDALYAVVRGQGLTFTVRNAWTRVVNPDVAPIFANFERQLNDDEYVERVFGHIIAENISKYELPDTLGGLTLTIDEANDLVGKSPEEIKESVKTAGDMLLYMLASRTILKSGCLCTIANGDVWHHNEDARTVLSTKLGNCGSMANLANFLLEGDYEEIGFVNHMYPPNSGGGHVYNYIKYNDHYYIVDFSGYLFSNYDPANELTVLSLKKLEDYGTRWNEVFGGIAAIIVHTSPGMHLPNVFDEDNGIVYFPEDADFIILYETPGTGIEVRTKPVPSQIPDWRIPQ